MNKYTEMQKNFYEAETETMKQANHCQHNANPDYWEILLAPLDKMNVKKSIALDFGCGCGRNVLNMAKKYKLKEVHGCDISSNNVKYSESFLKENGITNSKFFTTDGVSLQPATSDTYDFLMSTIVLQHIPVYDIRKTILTDFYRVLKTGGVLSFQMGYGTGRTLPTAEYYDNIYDAQSTNSAHDCRVTDESQIINDLNEIGFKNITTIVRPAFEDNHTQWIFVRAEK
jgi:ubiquinone/menaquinone biosynthesis C-methylase UbiE